MIKVILCIILYFVIGFILGVFAIKYEYMESRWETFDEYYLYHDIPDDLFIWTITWPFIGGSLLVMYSVLTLLRYVCPDKKEEEE